MQVPAIVVHGFPKEQRRMTEFDIWSTPIAARCQRCRARSGRPEIYVASSSVDPDENILASEPRWLQHSTPRIPSPSDEPTMKSGALKALQFENVWTYVRNRSNR